MNECYSPTYEEYMYNPFDHLWSEREIAKLIEMAEADRPIKWKEIARTLNRSYSAVYKKYRKIRA